MASSLRLNSGSSRTVNGNSGIGGGSSSSGGASSSRMFQNRGALTKLSSSSSTSLSAGGGSRSSVPRPVNTSSLRKENGGQDISAVLVNRHGGKKIGWGSSLPDKTPASTATNTSTTPTGNNSITNDVMNTTRMKYRNGLGLGKPRATLDPTPEEALAAAEAAKKKELSGSSTQQQDVTDANVTTPAAPVSQNTPWALHAPTPQPRDPITGMPPASAPYDGRGGGGGPGANHGYSRAPDSQNSRYYNGQNQQYNIHQPSSSHHHHDYHDGGSGSYNNRYNDGQSSRYGDTYNRNSRGRYDSGSYDRHNQEIHQHQHHSNSYDNNRDNRYDHQSNYNQRRYDDRGGDDGGGYRDRRERYNHQYPPTPSGGGAIDYPNSYRDRHSYRNDSDSRNVGASGQNYNAHQYRRPRVGEEGYNNQTPIPPESSDLKGTGDLNVPNTNINNSSRVQRDTTRRGDASEYDRDHGTSSGGAYDPRYDRRSMSNNRDYNRNHSGYNRYQRDINNGRGGGYERRNDYGHHQGLEDPVVEEELEDDDEGDNKSPAVVGNGDKVNIKESNEGIRQDGKVEGNEDPTQPVDKDFSEVESEHDTPKQILRHDPQLLSEDESGGGVESSIDQNMVEKSITPSLERLERVKEEREEGKPVMHTSKINTSEHLKSLPEKLRRSDDGLSLDTASNEQMDDDDDDDDLSEGTFDSSHEIITPDDMEEENCDNVVSSVAVGNNTDVGENTSPLIDRELVIKQQQLNILNKVAARRKERRTSSGVISIEDTSKVSIEQQQQQQPQKQQQHHQYHQQQQQQVLDSDVSHMPSSLSNDTKGDREVATITTTKKTTTLSTALQISEEEQLVRETLRKEYLAKWAAERAARIEHRRRRNPRTRGVLFRRLDDGQLMNADLSEKEVTKRLERKLKKEARSRKLTTSSSLPSSKGAVTTTKSELSMPLKQGGRHSSGKSNGESKTSHAPVDDDDTSPTELPPIETKKDTKKETKKEIKKETKPLLPSPGPAVSAWVAGPPPGMVKKQSEQHVEPLSIISPVERKNNHLNFNNTSPMAVEDAASKYDKVLSSSLLEIGNSASWSSKPNPTVNTTPKVAVGPIMSNWTAFAVGQVEFPYQSFGDSSTKPPDNTTSGQDDVDREKGGDPQTSPRHPSPNAPGTGADWSMDFALPHDLLTSTAESEDPDAAATTNITMAVSDTVERNNGGRKATNSSKSSSRSKGRRKPLHNHQRANNYAPTSSSRKKKYVSKSNDSTTKKSRSSTRRPVPKSKKVGPNAARKRDHRNGGGRSSSTQLKPQPQPPQPQPQPQPQPLA